MGDGRAPPTNSGPQAVATYFSPRTAIKNSFNHFRSLRRQNIAAFYERKSVDNAGRHTFTQYERRRIADRNQGKEKNKIPAEASFQSQFRRRGYFSIQNRRRGYFSNLSFLQLSLANLTKQRYFTLLSIKAPLGNFKQYFSSSQLFSQFSNSETWRQIPELLAPQDGDQKWYNDPQYNRGVEENGKRLVNLPAGC